MDIFSAMTKVGVGIDISGLIGIQLLVVSLPILMCLFIVSIVSSEDE